jgi:RimJ/RimL family protein N-acetyltransferase
MTTEKSPLNISLQALAFPLVQPQQALPRFNELLQAMAHNLDLQAATAEGWHAKMNEFAVQNTIAFWLVMQEGACVGYVAVGYPEGPEKTIIPGDDVALGWYVLPDFRGKGMAGRAVALILEQLKKIPVNSIRVDIDDDNEPSFRLARKFVFTVSAQGAGADGRGWKNLLLVV